MAAEPVFLAPVRAIAPDDAALAGAVEQATRAKLLEDGFIVLDQTSVDGLVNADRLATCAAEPAVCAEVVMKGLPVRVGALARLERVESTVLGHVELMAPGAAAPLATVDVPIVPGNEHLLPTSSRSSRCAP